MWTFQGTVAGVACHSGNVADTHTVAGLETAEHGSRMPYMHICKEVSPWAVLAHLARLALWQWHAGISSLQHVLPCAVAGLTSPCAVLARNCIWVLVVLTQNGTSSLPSCGTTAAVVEAEKLQSLRQKLLKVMQDAVGYCLRGHASLAGRQVLLLTR
jgi:hypothetical protein